MLAKALLSFLRFWSVQIDVFEYCVNRVKTVWRILHILSQNIFNLVNGISYD